MINEYWPNDYSPVYIVKTDDKWNFVDVIDVYDMPLEYGGKSIKKQMYDQAVEYFKDSESWEKFIKHFEYVGIKDDISKTKKRHRNLILDEIPECFIRGEDD